MSDHLDEVRRALRQARKLDSPPGWRCVARLAVGGLRSVGFDREADEILVISSNGQGVVDCTTGERLFRNREADGAGPGLLQGRRLDKRAAPPIEMASLEGGGLPCVTDDGWTCRSISLAWPDTYHIVQPPGASIYFNEPSWAPYNKDATFYVMEKGPSETLAFGFSWTGKTLIWACSSDLFIWARHG